MGVQYYLLDRHQVEKILKNANFFFKTQKGSHAQWEGYFNNQRHIVTVDHLSSKKEKYGHRLLKDMITQSGMNKEEFYSYL